MKVLLVEDSERLQRSLLTGLHKSGFSVDQAFDGKQALEFVASNQYEVIILDLMIPKIDGLTVLTSIRRRENDVHILILSANDQTEDRIRGLDLGADDYLVKPFAFDELVSRLRALSRRSNGTKNPLIEIDGVKIHSVSRYVYFDGKEVPFTPHEYNIFEFMARRRGRVFSQEQLFEHIYDACSYVTRNALEAHISGLRKRLASVNAPPLIKTRRGFGYLIE